MASDMGFPAIRAPVAAWVRLSAHDREKKFALLSARCVPVPILRVRPACAAAAADPAISTSMRSAISCAGSRSCSTVQSAA